MSHDMIEAHLTMMGFRKDLINFIKDGKWLIQRQEHVYIFNVKNANNILHIPLKIINNSQIRVKHKDISKQVLVRLIKELNYE